ncbi:site-2 protease family protein [Limobrevibacterium gyesilva]|uniref:Site-2 protease family protein n=1 Tax=Limobrevibacterium gyesilva TaxID=2991712 RepID=A0AA42CE83_9PROT|nr:site-2 protease family protein [Limobrevibacterium gyesilva]MCW3475743.1 site-2 protease family protein [Limobrevibacterium gyesilva]
MTEIILGLLAAVLAITLHEAAHGYAALAMGDDTAKRMGRLSLNPLAHVDRVGTILVPGVLLLGQLLTTHHVSFLFGWAKPVPVAAWRFRNPRQGMMVVAAAGPAMNFFLGWLGALSLHAVPLLSIETGDLLIVFALYFMLANLVLGLFNLLPIPPLDGGRIAVGLLPEAPARALARLEGAGILIVLLIVFLLPQALQEFFGIRFNPVNELLINVARPAFRLLVALAGDPEAGVLIVQEAFGD